MNRDVQTSTSAMPTPRLHKQAAGPDPVLAPPVLNPINRDTGHFIVNSAVGGVAAGALARGLAELWQRMKGSPEFDPAGLDRDLPVAPVGKGPAPDLSVYSPDGHHKRASGDWIKDHITGPAGDWVGRQLPYPGGASNAHTSQYSLGLGIPAAALALYGGYKGVDWLLDSQRKKELADQLAQAQGAYNKVTGVKIKPVKEAEADPVAKLAELYVKQADGFADTILTGLGGSLGSSAAGLKPVIDHIPGVAGLNNQVLGGMLAYGLLAPLVTGKLTYDWASRRGQKAVLEEAMRRRAKLRSGGVAPMQATEVA